TITDNAMQRAPVFIFPSAREARKFGQWVEENFDEIKKYAEATTRVGKLRDIEQYSASRFRYLRFNFTTGDAAGQNMVTQASKASVVWVCSVYPDIQHYHLESNFATDKKSSQINILRTRGKRVIAEATIPARLLEEIMHTSVPPLMLGRQISSLGSF